MVGPEQGGKSFLRRFQEELFIQRNADGEINESALSLADDIVNSFRGKNNDFFVGVTLRGSMIRGYSVSESDLDMRILYDSSEASYTPKKLDDMYAKVQSEFSKRGINARITWGDLGAPDAGLPGNLTGFGALCELTFGKHVEKYRRRFSEALKSLPQESRARVLRDILLDLLYYETSRIPLMQERIPALAALSHADIQKIMEKRKLMWQRRIQDVFELQNI